MGMGTLKPISIMLLMVDSFMKKLVGVLCDLVVRVAPYMLLADFMFLDCEVDFQAPIILGKTFLDMGRVLIDL